MTLDLPGWLQTLLACCALYAGIRADLARLHERATHAMRSAADAHRRIDALLGVAGSRAGNDNDGDDSFGEGEAMATQKGKAAKRVARRAKEPSTWAALAGVAGAVGAAYPQYAPIAAIVATALGALGVALPERRPDVENE